MPPTINNNTTNKLAIIKMSYRSKNAPVSYIVKRSHDPNDSCSCLSFLFEFIFSKFLVFSYPSPARYNL